MWNNFLVMIVKKTMQDSGVCLNGCDSCKHYPYFHYIRSAVGEYIEEYIINGVHSVKNFTTNVTHTYNGKTWVKETTK